MKKFNATLILICLGLISKADYWTQKANFPGFPRGFLFSFSIGNKGYIGCGYSEPVFYFNDFWEYDPSTNIWTQKANMPPGPRWAATGFSINNKGYAGTGEGAPPTSTLQDFWEYDPATNIWTQISTFPSIARLFASSFSIGTKGYVGCGVYNHDFWQWDQTNNTWTLEDTLPARKKAVGFSINGKGYFSTGQDIWNNSYLNDLWEYDPAANIWSQKANLPAVARVFATAFTICDKAYLGTGEGQNIQQEFWQYNPVLNQWSQKTNVPGGWRRGCASFAIGNKAYLGLGDTGFGTSYNDLWEYTPDSACATGIEEFPTFNLKFSISPNPAKEFLSINYSFLNRKEKINLSITNIGGKKVFESQLLQSTISLMDFSKGIYFVEVNNGKQKAVKKFVKE